MTNHEKNEIKILLDQYCKQYPSQAKAAATLKNVSESTVIQIRKMNWERVSEEMWRNVAKQVGFSNRGEWQMAQTRTFSALSQLFSDAQEFSVTHAIVSSAGSGKTFTAEWYEKNHRNVYHIVCAEYFTPKNFLAKLLKKMGKDPVGSVNDMMDMIIETLLRLDSPLIILDEADKLRDRTLYFFITLYNMLNNKCGLVLMATNNLMTRITRRQNRLGYEEIFSRVGRRFISLPDTDKRDVQAICEANGITDPATIMAIYNDYDKDLRRVEKLIHRTHRQRDKEIRLETA